MRALYPVVASLAGAITALSFRPFRDMTKGEVFMALFVGASFAMFVGPWAVKLLPISITSDIRLQAGIFYLMASGSNALIPMAIKWFGRVVGLREEQK